MPIQTVANREIGKTGTMKWDLVGMGSGWSDHEWDLRPEQRGALGSGALKGGTAGPTDAPLRPSPHGSQRRHLQTGFKSHPSPLLPCLPTAL